MCMCWGSQVCIARPMSWVLDSTIRVSSSTHHMPNFHLPHQGEKNNMPEFLGWSSHLLTCMVALTLKPNFSPSSFKRQWVTKPRWFSLCSVSLIWHLQATPSFANMKHGIESVFSLVSFSQVPPSVMHSIYSQSYLSKAYICFYHLTMQIINQPSTTHKRKATTFEPCLSPTPIFPPSYHTVHDGHKFQCASITPSTGDWPLSSASQTFMYPLRPNSNISSPIKWSSGQAEWITMSGHQVHQL